MPLTPQFKPPGSRSNRMLTQKVIHDVADFFITTPETQVKKIYGPLRLNYNNSTFELFIRQNLILKIDKNKQEILVTNGGHFDKHGNPTASTRELINGIFDALEAHNITNYTRAYIENQICKICLLTKNKTREDILDKDHPAVKIPFKRIGKLY